MSTVARLSQIEIIRKSSTAAQNFRSILQNQLNEVHAAGTYKNERIISSPQKTEINIEGSSKSVINFCANNYLGMSVSAMNNLIKKKSFKKIVFKMFFLEQ